VGRGTALLNMDITGGCMCWLIPVISFAYHGVHGSNLAVSELISYTIPHEIPSEV
jgi:hypothetical protein